MYLYSDYDVLFSSVLTPVCSHNGGYDFMLKSNRVEKMRLKLKENVPKIEEKGPHTLPMTEVVQFFEMMCL